jgi:hypothetical protein
LNRLCEISADVKNTEEKSAQLGAERFIDIFLEESELPLARLFVGKVEEGREGVHEKYECAVAKNKRRRGMERRKPETRRTNDRSKAMVPNTSCFLNSENSGGDTARRASDTTGWRMLRRLLW